MQNTFSTSVLHDSRPIGASHMLNVKCCRRVKGVAEQIIIWPTVWIKPLEMLYNVRKSDGWVTRKHPSRGVSHGWQGTGAPAKHTTPSHPSCAPFSRPEGHFITACQRDRAARCLSAPAWDENEASISLFFTTDPWAVRADGTHTEVSMIRAGRNEQKDKLPLIKSVFRVQCWALKDWFTPKEITKRKAKKKAFNAN